MTQTYLDCIIYLSNGRFIVRAHNLFWNKEQGIPERVLEIDNITRLRSVLEDHLRFVFQAANDRFSRLKSYISFLFAFIATQCNFFT